MSPVACFTLPFSASALPSISSRFIHASSWLGVTFRTRWRASDYRAAAADDADQEQHDGDDQQHVDDRSDRVHAHQSEQPGYEQNHRECEQHVLSLHVTTGVLMTAALMVPV